MLEKDKVIPGSLRRMWNRFVKQERMRNAQKYSRVEMTEQGADDAETGALTGAAGGTAAKTNVPFSAEADMDDELDDEDVGDD